MARRIIRAQYNEVKNKSMKFRGYIYKNTFCFLFITYSKWAHQCTGPLIHSFVSDNAELPIAATLPREENKNHMSYLKQKKYILMYVSITHSTDHRILSQSQHK